MDRIGIGFNTCMTATLLRRVLSLNVELLALNALELPRRGVGGGGALVAV